MILELLAFAVLYLTVAILFFAIMVMITGFVVLVFDKLGPISITQFLMLMTALVLMLLGIIYLIVLLF